MNYKIGDDYVITTDINTDIVVQLNYILEDLIEYKKFWAIISYKDQRFTVPLKCLRIKKIE